MLAGAVASFAYGFNSFSIVAICRCMSCTKCGGIGDPHFASTIQRRSKISRQIFNSVSASGGNDHTGPSPSNIMAMAIGQKTA